MYDHKLMVVHPLLPTGGLSQPRVPGTRRRAAIRIGQHQAHGAVRVSLLLGETGGEHE